MATPTGTDDKRASVTIEVTIKNGQGSADKAEARCGDAVSWTIGGDLGPNDEVVVGPFRGNSGAGSPMTTPQATRKGKGQIDNTVKGDARPDTYHYDITVNPASGAPSVIDPEIQIKP